MSNLLDAFCWVLLPCVLDFVAQPLEVGQAHKISDYYVGMFAKCKVCWILGFVTS